jgi:hypothetical protein
MTTCLIKSRKHIAIESILPSCWKVAGPFDKYGWSSQREKLRWSYHSDNFLEVTNYFLMQLVICIA